MNNSAADRRSPLGLFPAHMAPLPDALARNYPNADRWWGSQRVFPASSRYLDRGTRIRHRHHLHGSVIQKAVHQAADRNPQWRTVGFGLRDKHQQEQASVQIPAQNRIK